MLQKILFLLIRPIIFLLFGPNIYHKNHLPRAGPAIIAANHNSHLDIFILMSLYPWWKINKIRPVIAADHFFKQKFLKWFCVRILNAIPLLRNTSKQKDFFKTCHQALKNGDILIVFPEGTRGNPETIGEIKRSIFYMNAIQAPIVPVALKGAGQSLTKGTGFLVPFNIDAMIGPAIKYANAQDLCSQLEKSYRTLLHKKI